MSKRKEILEKIGSVPGIPPATAKIANIIGDPEYKIADLQRSIEFDPGLAANVLKMANSAYYAGPRSINSIREKSASSSQPGN